MEKERSFYEKFRDKRLIAVFSAGVVLGTPQFEAGKSQDNFVEAAETDGQSIKWLPERVRKYDALFEKHGEEFGVDPNFLRIIAVIENGQGYRDGIMQVMPRTARRVARQERLRKYNASKPYDSIFLASAYIRGMMDNLKIRSVTDANVGVLAAGYNGGELVAQNLYRRGKWPRKGSMPSRYMRAVSGMWQERFKDESKTYDNLKKILAP